MINKLRHSLLQLKQHRKLLLAVLPSLLIHLIAVMVFSFDLPETDSETQIIEARLVNVEAPKLTPQAPATLKTPSPQKPAQQRRDPQPDKPPAAEPQPQPSASNDLGTLSSATLNMAPLGNAGENRPETQNSTAQDSPYQFEPDPEKIVYTQVEAELEVKRGSDSSSAGTTKITFSIDKNKRYSIYSQTEAKGLVSLFFSNLVQKSEGTVTDEGLRPDFYSYQYGTSAKKSQTASFDWEKRLLTMRNAKGESSVKLADGTQDFLSFMYQFMFTPPLDNLQITMTNGKKLRTYNYTFEGEETISSKFGELKTIHLLKSSDDDEKTEIWLATEYQYLPVKIRKTEKDGTVIEQLISKLSTNQAN